jgi:hypothetical protein
VTFVKNIFDWGKSNRIFKYESTKEYSIGRWGLLF